LVWAEDVWRKGRIRWTGTSGAKAKRKGHTAFENCSDIVVRFEMKSPSRNLLYPPFK
jgi:hypothetical protein